MTLSETVGTAPGTDFGAARRAMIDSQLRTSGVNEHWVLAAMNRVPREDYVPADWRDAAYLDRAVPLGNGRMLAAPVVHGMMLAHARPATDDKVLLVGDSGGYLAALLAPLCGSLDVLDPSAAANGAAEADYTLLIVDGAVEVLPDALGGAHETLRPFIGAVFLSAPARQRLIACGFFVIERDDWLERRHDIAIGEGRRKL